MASGTIWLSSDISTLSGKIEWSSYSNGTSANSSTVSATLYISRTDWYTTTGTWDWGFNVGGVVDNDDWYGSISGDWVAIKTITNSNVAHSSDGTGHCYIEGYVNGPSGTSMAGHSVSGSENVTLDSIPRYANITSFRISNTGLESITVNWNADANIDWLQYSLNGAAWANASGNTFTISNLSPNTLYNVKIQVRRADSGLWTQSNTVSGKTKDIAKVTAAPDINLGDNATITITNPSNSNIIYYVELLNPTRTVLERTATAGDNTIVFTDSELDMIYKEFTNSNSISIRFGVSTKNSYWNWQDKTCTLTGNQKTGHIKLENSWKRVKHYRKIDNEWKHCVRWININGTWKRCI